MAINRFGVWVARALAVTAAVMAALLAYAPYIPRLLVEGYPSSTWPAPGTFATVQGTTAAAPLRRSLQLATPDAELTRQFDETEGRALLVARDGQLVMEHYGHGAGPSSLLNSYSMVKSLIGLLVLKAVSEGRIASIDDPIGRYLPEAGDEKLRAVPLRDFLDMRSGIEFEPHGLLLASGSGDKDIEATRLNLFGPMAELHALGLAPVMVHLRVSDQSRGVFSYQNINTALLGEVLSRIYRLSLETQLSETIWKPAGAASAHWRRYAPNASVTPYCCLYARPIDWLRVGLFVLSNGLPGQPFLPQPLWRRAMGLDLEPGTLKGGVYAFQIRHDILNREGEALRGPFAYFLGSRGQLLYIVPDRKLVVLRFGEKFQKLHTTLYLAWRSIAAGP